MKIGNTLPEASITTLQTLYFFLSFDRFNYALNCLLNLWQMFNAPRAVVEAFVKLQCIFIEEQKAESPGGVGHVGKKKDRVEKMSA